MNPNEWIMRDRYEQADCYSDEEYQRRWALTRRIMSEHGADLLLVLDAAREGHDTWFTGRKRVEMVIVPKSGDVLAVLSREYEENMFPFCAETADYSRYVKQKAPYIRREGLTFLNYPAPDDLAALLARFAPKKLGIVNRRLMSHALHEALKARLGNTEMIDLKEALDSQKTVKSAEELVPIRFAARTLEQLHDILPFVIRPGVTSTAATQALKNAALDIGGNGDLHIMLIPTGPMDKPEGGGAPSRDARHASDAGPIFHEGDSFFTIVECGGYGGHQLAMGRIGCLGPATPAFRQAVARAGEYNRFAASLMKPGNTLGNIARAAEAKAIADGTHLRRMCWMHGLSSQGYYEQFSLNDYGMEWPLTDGALLHCHPNYFRSFPDSDSEKEMMCVNTYIVTPDGGMSVIDLNRYPMEVIEIDC